MNAVRLGTEEVSQQEKESFVILDSVSAFQSQQYTHNTSTPLSTMSLRHQSEGQEGERWREGDKSLKKSQERLTGKKKQTPKSAFVEMYGIIMAGSFPSMGAECTFPQNINNGNGPSKKS